MKAPAAKRVNTALDGARIKGMDDPDPEVAGRVIHSDPAVIHIDRSTIVGSIFENVIELPKTLLHEDRHVQQFEGMQPGAEVTKYYNRNKNALERDADQYMDANYAQ